MSEKIMFKNHPLMIISELGTSFYLILISIITNLDTLKEVYFSIKEGNFLSLLSQGFFYILGAFLLVLVIILFFSWRKWYLTSYILEKDTLTMQVNRLKKSTLVLAKKDISNINLSQNLLQKICGLYKISLNTNTSVTAYKTDMQLFLAPKQANWLKSELSTFSNSSENPTSTDNPNRSILYEKIYSQKEVIHHTILNTSWRQLMLPIVALMIFLAQKILFDTLDYLPPSFWQYLNLASNGYLKLSFVLLALFLWGQGMVSTYLSTARFSIKRTENAILLTHGLITHKNYALPLEKIHAIILRQGFLARLFNYVSVEAVNIGLNDEKNEKPHILLQAPKSEVLHTLAIILPEYSLEENLPRQIKKSLVIYYLEKLPVFLTLLLSALYLFQTSWYYLIVPLLCYLLIKSYATWRTNSFLATEKLYTFVKGDFDKTTTLILPKRIEQVFFYAPITSRYFNLYRAQVAIMGSGSPSRFGYYSKKDLSPLIDLMKNN